MTNILVSQIINNKTIIQEPITLANLQHIIRVSVEWARSCYLQSHRIFIYLFIKRTLDEFNYDSDNYIPHPNYTYNRKYRWPRLVASSQTQVIGPQCAALNLRCQVDPKIVDALEPTNPQKRVFSYYIHPHENCEGPDCTCKAMLRLFHHHPHHQYTSSQHHYHAAPQQQPPLQHFCRFGW